MGCCQSKVEKAPIKKQDPELPTSSSKGSSSSKQASNKFGNFGNAQASKGIRKGNFIQTKQGDVKQFYQIIKEIGSGGFGTVYTVKDRRSGLQRAMKELPKDRMDRESNEKMLEEVEILRELDHPNIMKIYEVIESAKSYFIISEFLSGGELFDKIIETQGFNEKIAAKYFVDMMSAINYCHSNGIVHRDLKPENLLLESADSNANLKVIDFGISQRLMPGAKLTSSNGTLFYMAPEVFSGSHDEKCDIWSAGTILYIMLCGQPPFYADSDTAYVKLIQKGHFNLSKGIWSSISEDAKDLLRKMLAVSPTKRLSAQDTLNHPWVIKYLNNSVEETPISSEALSNLGKFRDQSKIAKSIKTFITSQIFTAKDEANLVKIFKRVDKNGDGKLSRAELMEGYNELGLTSPTDIEAIMKNCDTDNSGFIDFTEFVTATTEWNQMLNQNQLKQAFQIYDASGDGTLSLDELKTSIPGIEDTEWKKFLDEADKDGDGVITFAELKDYLLSKLN
ncbi:unnamed protein product [Blepharisma stoltei]|uniref:non-specific serine/threonine protein kinase n=1 Tax=Blepharisma stoltei TaxID=1481888 RepID=A0AAU9JNI7_9CILI|nr:unnamed protein product [Blepharisma stoltei]